MRQFVGPDLEQPARQSRPVATIAAKAFDHDLLAVETPQLGDFHRRIDSRPADFRRRDVDLDGQVGEGASGGRHAYP